MITNPIKYSSRSFQSILNDIDSDAELAIKPNWWKRIWAGVGDVISIWINALANLLFLRTSYTRGAVSDIVQLIDYYLSAQSTSSGQCLFYVKTSLGTGIFNFTVAKGDLQARSQGGLTTSSKLFQSRANVTFSLVSGTFTVNATTDILTVAINFLYTGHKVRVTTDTTLPAPLQANTDYYVIYLSATEIKLASTLEDALAGNYIDLTDTGTGIHTFNLFSKSVLLYQQESVTTAVSIGVSDGVTLWQEFDFPDKYILTGTELVTINGVTWTLVTTFVNSTSSSKHYKIIPKSNGMFSIRFGNGVYGMIPPAFDIMAIYSYGGGANSNVTTLNRINSYAGADSKITGVSNCTAFTGGADEELIENAKAVAPLLLKSRDRFIEEEDGLAFMLAYGGVAQARIVSNYYGPLSCKAVGIATGGGQLSSGVRTAIQTLLISKSILENVRAQVEPAVITSIAVTSAAKMLGGYTFTGSVDKFFSLAFKLFLTETGNEIKNNYLSLGIESAVNLINTIFSTTFTTVDYPQIKKLLDNLTPRNFGDVIQESDIFTYVQGNVFGIDYMTISVFGSLGLPLTLAPDEITTPGSLSLTEI